MANTYGYARVSSADQNEARQIVALTDAGIDFRGKRSRSLNTVMRTLSDSVRSKPPLRFVRVARSDLFAGPTDRAQQG